MALLISRQLAVAARAVADNRSSASSIHFSDRRVPTIS